MGYFIIFLHTTDFLPLVPYPMHKKITKKSFTLLIFKSKKFHNDSVKNESYRAKKLEGGGAPNALPPSLYKVKYS